MVAQKDVAGLNASLASIRSAMIAEFDILEQNQPLSDVAKKQELVIAKIAESIEWGQARQATAGAAQGGDQSKQPGGALLTRAASMRMFAEILQSGGAADVLPLLEQVQNATLDHNAETGAYTLSWGVEDLQPHDIVYTLAREAATLQTDWERQDQIIPFEFRAPKDEGAPLEISMTVTPRAPTS